MGRTTISTWTDQMFPANSIRDDETAYKNGRDAAQADIVLAKPSIEGRAVRGQVHAAILHHNDGLVTPHNPKSWAELQQIALFLSKPGRNKKT